MTEILIWFSQSTQETDIMPWLCVDHMIQQGVWLMRFSYPDLLANPDPLRKSRPTGKIQTH